jgi:hypothetical protein
MMQKTKFIFGLMLLFGIAVTSCTKDDDIISDKYNSDGEYIGENPFVLVLAYAPAEGYDYSYYPVQFESIVNDSTLSAVGVGSITQVGYYEYSQLGQTIYSSGGLGYTDVSAITRDAEGELMEDAFGVNFTNSIADVITADDGKLIGMEMSTSSDVVVLHLIDNETNSVETSTTTSCFDISANMDADHLPHNTGLAQSGNYVFVSYYIFGAGYTSPFTDAAEVAVFSYPELEYIKTIKDTRTGPIGGWATNSGLFTDDAGNVYAVSHTNLANGYSQSNATAGFLRINSGESEFDASYFFDLTATGDGFTTANALYIGDNKVYAEMNVAVRSEQTAWSDGPLKSAVVDLEAKTVTYFQDCPEHFGPGRDIESTALYNDGYIYNPITTDDGIYIYRMNPSDMTITKGSKVNASFVAGTFRLN